MIIQLLRKHGFKYSYKNPETITRETDLTITCNFFLTKHAHSLQKAAIDFFLPRWTSNSEDANRPSPFEALHGIRSLTWFIVYPRQTARTIISVPLHLNEFR